MESTEPRSRHTRSRSRSLMPQPQSSSSRTSVATNGHANMNGNSNGHAAPAAIKVPVSRSQEETVPAAANGTDAAAAAAAPLRKPVAAAVPAPLAISPVEDVSQTVPLGERTVYDRNNSGEDRDQFYWCAGEPTVRKIAAHLDALTGSEIQLRAAHSSLAESFTALNDTVSALMDSNQRLRRELRAQKLSSARRWLWGGLALLLCTFGLDAIRTTAAAAFWALEHPALAWPVLIENVQVWSLWLWLLAFPLTLALFVHSMLNAYSHGRMSLPRTLGALVLGIGMQIPMLYALTQFGIHLLSQLQSNPLFAKDGANASFNDGVTLAVWSGLALLDYVLIVLHYYIH